MMVGHLIGNANHDSRPLTSLDYSILVSLSVSLLGLGIAWRYEVVGAIVALLGISVCAWINWRVLMFPGTLIPLAAVLFLVAALGVRRKPQFSNPGPELIR
jgi:sulfite exporter TauE/SafE